MQDDSRQTSVGHLPPVNLAAASLALFRLLVFLELAFLLQTVAEIGHEQLQRLLPLLAGQLLLQSIAIFSELRVRERRLLLVGYLQNHSFLSHVQRPADLSRL